MCVFVDEDLASRCLARESRSQVLAIINENLSYLPETTQSGVAAEPLSGLFLELEVSVSVETGLLAENSVVYVVARAVDGMPAPLAVARLEVAALPATVRLDDSMAMIPGHTLSSAEGIEVVARISQDGNPAEKAGDFTSAVRQVDSGLMSAGGPLQLVIDRQVTASEQ